jgi:hypothetical protein
MVLTLLVASSLGLNLFISIKFSKPGCFIAKYTLVFSGSTSQIRVTASIYPCNFFLSAFFIFNMLFYCIFRRYWSFFFFKFKTALAYSELRFEILSSSKLSAASMAALMRFP